ncbi:MAG: hypothetical protein AAF125_13870 [Chloroflexota bacterium]
MLTLWLAEAQSMGIDLKWLVADRVIFGRYYNTISLEELRSGMNHIADMIDETEPPTIVHTLIDNADLLDYPRNPLELREASRKLLAYPRYGWLLVYGHTPPFTQFIIRVAISIFGVQYRVFNTRAEAIAFLKHVDADAYQALVEVSQADVGDANTT